MTLKGYEIVKTLYDGPNTIVYRGIRLSDKHKIILKTPKKELLGGEDLARLKYEYHLLKSLKIPGIPKVLDLIEFEEKWLLVFEDEGYESFSEVQKMGLGSLKRRLHLAINIVQILEQIHSCNLIHQDIKPGNITIKPQNDELQIIDFGAAIQVSGEQQRVEYGQQTHWTLAYMSPEQTGRMNRMIDFRTDFYSYGVTLYEMFTGQLPFTAKEPLEIFYNHIAIKPTAPHLINARVPLAISNIIMKLLEKNAEDRYQSANGIIYDLNNALDQLLSKDKIEDFPLAQHDFSVQFYIKEKLYGREEELAEIMQEFENLGNVATNQLVFVTGYPGIGKTSLIDEVAKPSSVKSSFLIKGKFDKYSKDMPYHPFSSGFSSLLYEILAQSENIQDEWRQKILAAAGRNGQILIDLIPELKLLLGEQPPIPEVGIEETEKRFITVFLKFIGLFSTPQKSLVIFLDDLQWAPNAALKIIKKIITTDLFSKTLLIGSYRDNEVREGHPLNDLIFEMEKERGTKLKKIHLRLLSKENIRSLIIDSFNFESSKAQALAEICFEKSGQNPFFLKQFLKQLHERGLITCDQKSGRWNCDIEKITQEKIPDNLTDFMIERLAQLSPQPLEILQIGSCIGVEFDLQILVGLISRDRSQIINELLYLKKNALIYVSEGILEYASEDDQLNVVFKFSHDKIQEAAYNLFEEKKAKKLHLQIAHWYIAASEFGLISSDCLRITSHYNQARELVNNPSELALISQYNLEASQRSRKTADYETALKYCQVGLKNLKRIDAKHPDLEKELKKELAVCQFLNRLYDASDATYNELLNQSGSEFETVEIYESKISNINMKSKFNEVIAIGLKIFDLLGCEINHSPSQLSIVLQFLKVRALMFFSSKLHNLKYKKCDDKKFTYLLRLYLTIFTALFLTNKNLLVLISLKIIESSMKYGSHVGTSLALLILSAMSGSLRLYKNEFEFSLLAKDLIDKYATPSDGYVPFTYGIIVHYKYFPLKDGIEPMYNNFLNSMDVGKWETAVISLHQSINMMVCAGIPIEEILKKIEHQYSTVKEINELDEIFCFRSIYQHLNYLNGTLADKPEVLEQILPTEYESLDKNKFPKTMFIYSMYSLMNSFIFGKYEEAYRTSEVLEELFNKKFAEGMFFWMIFFLFRPLVLIQLLPIVKIDEREHLKHQLTAAYKRLELFAKHYPANTYNKYLLVKAELMASESNEISILELYEEAIATSKEKELFHELALANELAGNFLLKINRKRAAYGYLREAYYYYERWGAKAKAYHLIKTYPKVFSEFQNSLGNDENYSTSTSMNSESFTNISNKVDIDALLKSSQMIAGEIRIEYLIDKILNLIVQSSGAEKVVLLLMKNKELFVNGYFSSRASEQYEKLNGNSLQNYITVHYLPHHVIDFVYNNKKYLIEDDISSNEIFMNDPYIKREGTHSVLCYPLQKSGNITGILYLENNLAKGAFTSGHLSVLDVLSGEIATMLEIANSYRAFERFVPKEFLIPLGKEKITDVSIGDCKEINISILFSDIKSFTNITEHLTSRETFDLLNRLFSLFNPIVIKNKGFIDKYIGDAIMALFPMTADDALESAMGMQNIVRQFQQEIVKNTGVSIQVGIGLNTGPAILGVLGSMDHMNTTVVSDAVNISSRLESLTKEYGSQILLSESFYQSLNFPDRYMISFVDSVILKGKSGSTKIYEVFSTEICSAELFNQCEQEYLKAWEKYAQGDFIEAHEGFTALLKSHPNKIRVKLFIERCREFILQGMPEEWKGTTKLLSK